MSESLGGIMKVVIQGKFSTLNIYINKVMHKKIKQNKLSYAMKTKSHIKKVGTKRNKKKAEE